MKLLVILGLTTMSVCANAQLISDFSGSTNTNSYDTWTNAVEAGGFRTLGTGVKGNGGSSYAFTTDLSGVANARVEFVARLDAGNQADLQMVLEQTATATNAAYRYFYVIPASAFTVGSFFTFNTNNLNNPNYVLDSANGYANVGSGTAFSPDLSKIKQFDIQAVGYNGAQDIRWTMDKVSVVPEPATMAALGLGVAAMLRRRKSTK
jgi:hypothetical protein